MKRTSRKKRPVSGRERWMIALAPAIAIGGIYFFFIAGGLQESLENQRRRLEAAERPAAAAGPSTSFVQAKAALQQLKSDIAGREGKVNDLAVQLASARNARNTTAADDEPARVIERIETTFARNGVTPIISETQGHASTGNPRIIPLLNALDPRSTSGGDLDKDPRVWHYVFNDVTPRFQKALKELESDAPTVVPLSMNLVYNPETRGQTRLLELWLLY